MLAFALRNLGDFSLQYSEYALCLLFVFEDLLPHNDCFEEFVCHIKSQVKHFKAIEQAIKNVHSYDCPEIISFNFDAIPKRYKDWLDKEI